MIKININDFDKPKKTPINIWKEIFTKQRELIDEYKKIEDMGSLLEETYKNIDTGFGQKWIKDFAWRVTEEIAEALEAKAVFAEASLEDDKELIQLSFSHYAEEMIDALHFLTELTIIAGYDETIFKNEVLPFITSQKEWEIVYKLGVMCNCLKNKPWKQSEMLTDRPKFKLYLQQVWLNYIAIMNYNNIFVEDIYDLYFRKHSVNKFRIRSKY